MAQNSPSFCRFLKSSVFQKVTMALTGLFLIVFVVMHLAGNLFLYFPDSTRFNEYAQTLHSLGALVYVAEVGLLALFGLHIVTALAIKKEARSARPERYKMYQSKGGPSKASFASRFMIISGLVLLVFLAIHIWQFRFGPGITEGYTTLVKGAEARDLHKLVVETFKNPIWVFFYVFSMILLSFHLRHGFWSAFQSLGMRNPGLHNILYKSAILIAAIISLGFLGIPLWIYFQF